MSRIYRHSKYCCSLTRQCGNFTSPDGCEWVELIDADTRLSRCPFPLSVVCNHIRMYDEDGHMI
jgi:hypothetical protein